ncbi:hypothetical protein [Paracoccus sp. S1E-3]|uniref:hypothetical protein n=1 Tax=Paracoccus sp. S1E-3 TaxID=2756130 RepID=UPI0015EF2948|nr:hypothetical protein [Paracoccus sp. S1E-3]MBA4490466.1 hypothetical protein [Paracoccus sp. S1E-3]
MKRSTRVLILLVVFEALVIGGGYFSITQIRSGAWDGGTQPEELIKGISETVTMLVPVIGGIFIFLFLLLWTAERRARKAGSE